MVPLTGSGGLFARIGAIVGLLDKINLHAGTTVPTAVEALAGHFSTNPDLIDGLFSQFAAYPSASSVRSYLQKLAATTVQEMVNADSPLYTNTLAAALGVLIAQMQASGQSVAANHVDITSAPVGTPAGDAAWVVTATNDLGRPQQNQFAETLLALCTADSYSGGKSIGSEQITVTGLPTASAPLNPDWPGGSATKQILTAIDATLANSTTSGPARLANGGFEAFGASGAAASIPIGWNLRIGGGGTQTQASTTAYSGSKSLAIVGDGSTLTQLDQVFGSTAGNVPLAPQTTYAWSMRWSAPSGHTPTQGLLEVALVDGADNITVDGSGTANSIVLDLTQATTLWGKVGGTMRSPVRLPATLKFRLRLTAPLNSGATILLDHLGFGPVARLYTGGPAVACFSGATPLAQGDATNLVATNDHAGAFQAAFDRCFGMKSLGYLLPTAASPTIPASLIA